ncbi:hypothetical protein [Ferruginibacter sp.]|uniref:hypothetical protein n=1 Tax=Ferruginibacter sp. TaxID=1940288 RepID=UPI0026587343|nr:hypothetical protein [Ferruginibacter sp.]
MKKILIAFCMMFGFAGVATAQAVPKPATTKPADMKVVKKEAASTKVVKMDKLKPVASPGLKADGTPDMRLKENKAKVKAATVAGPTKKDGTADMRYKANKKKN